MRNQTEESQLAAVAASAKAFIEAASARDFADLFVSGAAIVAESGAGGTPRLSLARIGQEILLYRPEFFGLTLKSGITSMRIAFAAADAWLAAEA